jgi:hypothetical protein
VLERQPVTVPKGNGDDHLLPPTAGKSGGRPGNCAPELDRRAIHFRRKCGEYTATYTGG